MPIRTSPLAAFRLAPIHAGAEDNPLGICLLVRRTPNPAEGHFVLLRSTTDAVIYLGCICDAGETIREWIEIWVQSLEGLNSSFSSAQETFSKERLSERWKQQSLLLADLEGERFVRTGWETRAAKPVLVEAETSGTRAVTFNPEGGFLRVLSFCPFSLEEYIDLLSSDKVEPESTDTSKTVFESLGIVSPELLDQRGALLFGKSKAPGARLVEVFHLKAQLICDALEKVREFVARQQLPFLNLSAETFRVRLARVGNGLPVFWTAEVGLSRTGEAHALSLLTGKARHFVRTRAAGESIYLPRGINRFTQGSGVVRIRKVNKE